MAPIKTMKAKFNLSIDSALLKLAERQARDRYTDFAGYITQLIVADLENKKSTAAQKPQKKTARTASPISAAA